MSPLVQCSANMEWFHFSMVQCCFPQSPSLKFIKRCHAQVDFPDPPPSHSPTHSGQQPRGGIRAQGRQSATPGHNWKMAASWAEDSFCLVLWYKKTQELCHYRTIIKQQVKRYPWSGKIGCHPDSPSSAFKEGWPQILTLAGARLNVQLKLLKNSSHYYNIVCHKVTCFSSFWSKCHEIH